MERRLRLSSGLACALAAGFVAFGSAAADEAFTPTAIVKLFPKQVIQSFDISYVDPVIRLYVFADRTNAAVDAIDPDSSTEISQFTGFVGFHGSNDTAGPNGVLIVNHSELWAGDGDSTIKVFDIAGSHTVPIATIKTGGKNRADELCADEKDGVVLMANDAEDPAPFITFSSIPNHALIPNSTIVFDGKSAPKATNGIEQCQFDKRTNKFYLNLPEVNGKGDNSSPGAVVTISPETLKIEGVFTIPRDKCIGPQGMAIGPRPQILLGCNGHQETPTVINSTVVVNEHNPSNILATLDNESGSDEVWFNRGDGHYFLARSAAVGSQQLGVVDSRGDKEDASFPTGTAGASGNHSVAADSETNHVFVPIASKSGSTVCSTADKVNGVDANGCIAIFTTQHDDRVACNAQGSPVIKAGDHDHDSDVMQASCHDRDRD